MFHKRQVISWSAGLLSNAEERPCNMVLVSSIFSSFIICFKHESRGIFQVLTRFPTKRESSKKAFLMKPTSENYEANISHSTNVILNTSVSKISFYPASLVLIRKPHTLKCIRQYTATVTWSLGNNTHFNSWNVWSRHILVFVGLITPRQLAQTRTLLYGDTYQLQIWQRCKSWSHNRQN
jgi:hypothetical protein